MSLQVIQAVEDKPPPGAEPVCWLLLTTLPVTSFEDVVQCKRGYSYRLLLRTTLRERLIERYHYVLKSGCRIEQLQLETAERIHRDESHLHDCGVALVVDYLFGALRPRRASRHGARDS